jgi:hypothetical protein
MWRNFSRIGLNSRKIDSESELFSPDNFADTDLSSEKYIKQFLPVMLQSYDEEDLVLGFDCIGCSTVKNLLK